MLNEIKGLHEGVRVLLPDTVYIPQQVTNNGNVPLPVKIVLCSTNSQS